MAWSGRALWTWAKRHKVFSGVLGAIVVIFIIAGAVESNNKAKTTSATNPEPSSTAASTSASTASPSTAAPTLPVTTSAPATTVVRVASGCRSGNPLANVYHPYRLKVISACMTVSGTVEVVRAEDDGDTHFDLALDPSYEHLLTPENTSGQHGWLVAEIVPADKPGCALGQPPRPASGSYDYGICTGADEVTPTVGAHVTVTGPYVLDEDHGGWAEIHPVWAISEAGSTTATTNVTSPGSQVSPTTAPVTSGVTIVSVTSPVGAGSGASLVARTSPNASCNLSVTLPSGYQSQSSGLGPASADANGQVTWNWKTGSSTKPGTATATVTCGAAQARATFQIT